VREISLCATFMALVSTGKRKVLDVAMKCEIIHASENDNVSKSEIGRCYSLSSSTLYDSNKLNPV
jgi:hypothetical protein